MRTGTALSITNPQIIGPDTVYPNSGAAQVDLYLSESIRIGEEDNTLIIVYNPTPSAIDIRYYGSIDDVNFIQLGAGVDPTTTITEGASGLPTKDSLSVDDPWPFIRVSLTFDTDVTITDAPNNVVLVQWSSKRSRLNVV